MSSSTSSSEKHLARGWAEGSSSPRTAPPEAPCSKGVKSKLRRIALSLFVLLVLLEIFNRAVLLPRSKDLLRFRAYPAQAAEFVERPGMRLAFIGNSATQCGVDPALIEAELPAAAGRKVSADRF